MDAHTRNVLGAMHERLRAIRWLSDSERMTLSSFPAMMERVIEAEAAVERVREAIGLALAAEDSEKDHRPVMANDVLAQLTLNRHVLDSGAFLRATAADARPHLEAKLASMKDPLYDYAMVAKLDYTLREDDPAYDDEDDNILATREEMLSSDRVGALDADCFSGGLCGPPGIEQELHGRMLDDRCGHRHGRPKLSFRDCLRVGKIFIDVHISQQYCFDLEAGKWVKAWHRDGIHVERHVDIEQEGTHDR